MGWLLLLGIALVALGMLCCIAAKYWPSRDTINYGRHSPVHVAQRSKNLYQAVYGVPCDKCGPGYYVGDDGCRHSPKGTT